MISNLRTDNLIELQILGFNFHVSKNNLLDFTLCTINPNGPMLF